MYRSAITLAVFVIVAFTSCMNSKQSFPSETRTVFGVPVTVTIFLPDAKPEDLKSAYDVAFSTLTWFDEAALLDGPDNQLAKIAEGAGKESVPVDTAIYSMLMRGLQLNDMTGEAFDLRYGPLLDAWLAVGERGNISQADKDSALALIKTGGMFVAGKSILLSKPKMRFEGRGFVDAWAIDRAAEKLNAKGFSAFEIRSPFAARIVGMPANQQSREVSLGAPHANESPWANLAMGQGGMAYLPAKSGGGRLVIDPRTGEMATGASVVMAKDCATAFALAYAVTLEGDVSKLSDKGKAELMGFVRISGSSPNYSLTADGALKDRLKTLN